MVLTLAAWTDFWAAYEKLLFGIDNLLGSHSFDFWTPALSPCWGRISSAGNTNRQSDSSRGFIGWRRGGWADIYQSSNNKLRISLNYLVIRDLKFQGTLIQLNSQAEYSDRKAMNIRVYGELGQGGTHEGRKRPVNPLRKIKHSFFNTFSTEFQWNFRSRFHYLLYTFLWVASPSRWKFWICCWTLKVLHIKLTQIQHITRT